MVMNGSDNPVYDVVIIGAGLSGIGAAYHIQTKCPGKSFVLLESRASIGGTWDLFKYPGIRSDSDMYTLGFSFYPWKNAKSIADGPAILDYIKETASVFGIDKKIRFNHKVIDASWTDEEKLWTITIAAHGQTPQQQIKCRFMFACSGYYNYNAGYSPEFKNSNTFNGTIIHPQQWDTNLNYKDKKVVVIGSGATAVTLVPELAKQAAKVTMLQRSPTYVINLPSEDRIANFLKKIFPKQAAHTFIRWKNIVIAMLFYNVSRRWPNFVRKLIKGGIKKELGAAYDLKHFDPKYNPWDQRLCIIPDNDLFAALKGGKAEIVTDTIKEFTPNGILLESGKELEADIIVTATGLTVQLLGGMNMTVNGKSFNPQNVHCYRGVMFSDIPNFAVAIGYTNASWTLKCDLSCHYVTRVINHMDAKGHKVCVPKFDSNEFESERLLDFDAGYIKRAEAQLPRAGSRAPWKVYQNYFRDSYSLKHSAVSDKYLEYSS